MGGCTNCKGKSGCDHRKGAMFAALDDVLAKAYPSRTWGEPDDRDFRDPQELADDGAALAEELATELNAAAFYVPGGPDDLGDFVWILAMGRTPCILQVRDLGVAPPADWGQQRQDGRIDELYLRVALSGVARVAGVQQVALSAEPADEGWLIRETPRAGVYDAPLLRRFQRLVAILPAYDLLHVDFGEISAPPPGWHPGAWPELYGAPAPAVANYLFFPQPATTSSLTFLCSTTR